MMSSPAELQQTAQEIERACQAMEMASDAATRTAADAYLQSFRLTPRPYALCTMLLQGTEVSTAQYMALGTMKIAIQREGRVLGGAFLTQLKDELLNCLVQRANNWNRFVVNQCIDVIATLFKWICLDEDEQRLKQQQQSKTTIEERPAYINMANCVAQLLQRGSTPVATNGATTTSNTIYSLLALELSKALINQFTSSTSHANAGVSVSMHVRCHVNFEHHVLFNLANLILSQSLPTTLQSITNAASTITNTLPPAVLENLKILSSLLAFVDSLLTFPFEDPKRSDKLALKWALQSSSSADITDESLVIHPSVKWQPILVQSQLLDLITHSYHFLATLAQTPSIAASFQQLSESLHLARNCILHLASLRGPVLQDATPPPLSPFGAPMPLPDEPSTIALKFISRVIVSLNTLMERSITQVRSQSAFLGNNKLPIHEETGKEWIGFASIIKRIQNRSFGYLYALPEPAIFHQLLTWQHALSMLLIPHIVGSHIPGMKLVQTDTTKTECFDICLHNWGAIIHELSEDLKAPKEIAAAQSMMPSVKQFTGSIFESYVQSRMQSQSSRTNATNTSNGDGKESDGEGDDDDEEGQFMESSYVDEHLADIAALGRLHAQSAIILITNELNKAIAQWQQIITQSQVPNRGGGNSEISLYNIHESFYFLLRLLGHMICHGPGIDSSDRFCCIPKHIFAMVRPDSDGSGINALRTAIASVMNLATFTNQLLEHQSPHLTTTPSSPSNSVLQHQSLKEFCSPLVFESLIWLFERLVSTGYILIDVGRYEARLRRFRADELKPEELLALQLPVSLLQLYSGGNKEGVQEPAFGSAISPIVTTIIQTCVAFISSYNEEPTLMELTMELLETSARHVPLRLLFKQYLLSPNASVFKNFFLIAFMNLFTTDPYQLLQANNTQLLLQFQSEQRFYNLSPELLLQISDILTKCLTFNVEDDCNDMPIANQGEQALVSHLLGVKRQRRQQSLQALHSILHPMTQGFFSLLLNAQFGQQKTSALLLKFLTNYIAFYTGVVKELYVDNCDFLWYWISASDNMMQIPLNHTDIDAMVKELAKAAQASEVKSMHSGATTSGASSFSKQNLMQTMVELIRQYQDTSANTEDSGHILQLFSSILLFCRTFSDSFLPYLDKVQSYRFMQTVLALVNVFVACMEKRSVTNSNNPPQQSITSSTTRNEVRESTLSAIETNEWDLLHSLLLLLEAIGEKDSVDLSTDSIDFASDAVLSGLMLLLPRLSGGLFQRPEISSLFFNLFSKLVSQNPDKLASILNEGQRNQLLQVLLFVFEQELSMDTKDARTTISTSTTSALRAKLLKEACAAVQAVSQYHLYFVSGKAEKERVEAQALQVKGGLAPSAPPPPSPFAQACAEFLKVILRLLMHAHLSSELLDPFADALLPTILAQPQFFMAHVRQILDAWTSEQLQRTQRIQLTLGAEAAQLQQQQGAQLHQALEAGFQQLIPTSLAQASLSGAASRTYMSSKTMAIERSQRMVFRSQLREFVLKVRPLINSNKE